MSFAACLPIILASEGGFVVDQGGPTNLGVTIPILSAFLRRPVTVADIRALTPASVGPLYRTLFYNAAHCNLCPAGLDLMVFDEAVNQGQGHATRHLQQALGVPDDGDFGPATLAALKACDPVRTIGAIHGDNAAYYQSLAQAYPRDERGWRARNDRTRDVALAMAGAALNAGAAAPPSP